MFNQLSYPIPFLTMCAIMCVLSGYMAVFRYRQYREGAKARKRLAEIMSDPANHEGFKEALRQQGYLEIRLANRTVFFNRYNPLTKFVFEETNI